MYFETNKAPSLVDGEMVLQIQLEKTWMASIQEYLTTGVEPKENEERRKLKN